MTAKERAAKATKELFTDGQGKYHSHLSLDDQPNLGWSAAPVRDIIERHISEAEHAKDARCNKAEALIREQESIVLGVGKILCAQGKQHSAEYRTGWKCLYCEFDDEREARKKAEAAYAEMRKAIKSALAWLDRATNREFSYEVRPQDVKAFRFALNDCGQPILDRLAAAERLIYKYITYHLEGCIDSNDTCTCGLDADIAAYEALKPK